MAKKILIIDDDPVITKYLATLFEDNGYEAITARDGAEGFDLVKKQKPDLITLDLQLPDEWGPRFYRKLSKSEFKDTPIIVVSGMAGQHAVRKAVAYVSKPFDPDKLLGIVRKTIGE
ncbi:MAG: response regulator [Deltaproteobacteria bacterium]|nr:response regulator [Deltaproteobacteria bacterium]MBW1962795.1 response regulator [Deltaproteobacteria bacterium]MBW2151677.1 response regulator [Deltaproteobacteria bacterium]